MKVGIVGLGFRLGYLAPLFRAALPEFDVVGHVDPDPAGLPRMHDANLSAGKRYDTLEAMLEAERLDLLMVGSPNSMHLDHIRVGLERGMKIFCRKAGRHHGRRDPGSRASRRRNTAPTV